MPGALSIIAMTFADRGHILNVMAGFSGSPARSWLRLGHPAECGRIPADWNSILAIPPADLVEAVAVSAPNHCIDGWTFLARALQALTAGDFHTARHMAYYSQLRSGLSMLANLGIGIFNGINFIVDQNGRISRLDPPSPRARPRAGQPIRGVGTHSIVWDTLKAWVSEPASASVFLDLLKVGGISLGDGLEAISPGARSAVTANMIVEGWGLDLRRGKEDHSFRNISSYQPHLLNRIDDPTDDCLDYLDQFWTHLEPISERGFELLDRHLFRNLLWEFHRTTAPKTPRSKGMIARGYDQLQPALRQIMTKEFLVGEEEPSEIPLLTLARSRQDPASAMQMISRALMLGRAAIGFTNSSLQDAGGPNMAPWVEELVVSRGFLPPDTLLDSPSDLWADVEVALGDLRAGRTGPMEGLYSWLRAPTTGMPTLAQAERAGAWGLAS